MRSVQQLQIACTAVPGKASHLIIDYKLESGDPIYKDALGRAPALAGQLHPNGPNGEERSELQRETMAFTGTIAESVALEYLNICFRQLDPSGDVYAAPVQGVFRRRGSFNQIDIAARCKSSGKSATIEVRSSNIFKPETSEVYNKDQSLVGWYVTGSKAGEVRKDYYITLYFRHSTNDLQRIMQRREPLNVQIAAGASRPFIERHGTDSSLKQGSSAQFRIVNPIIRCSDIVDVAGQIYTALK